MVVAKLWLPAVLSEEKGVAEEEVDAVEGGSGICVLSAIGLEVIGWEREDG